MRPPRTGQKPKVPAVLLLHANESAGAAWLPRREVVRSRDSLAAASDAGYFRLGESVLLDCVIAYDFLLSWMSRLVPPPALLADM